MSGADKNDCANWCTLPADHEGVCRRGEESGWLIEANESDPSRPLYWAGSFGDERDLWTYDHLKAVRFARLVDAAAVAHGVLGGHAVRLAEHGWTP